MVIFLEGGQSSPTFGVFQQVVHSGQSRMSWPQNLAGIKNEMESKMSQNQKWSGIENELESKIESKIESKRKEDWIYLKC